MSDNDENLDREIESLASQLSDDQMDSIARRLGLRGDEQVHRTEAQGQCSFCGRAQSEVGAMVSNGAGARVCGECLAQFRSS
ncbi:ClpX C4-type zinc finger protein [Halomonadaceae bacterium KBTZ08]